MSYLYQMEPVFDDAEVQAVADCVRSSWVIEAERTAVFEQTVAAYTGAKYATAVPSCTIALAVSLMALGIGVDDEVIVPDLTFIATANAVNLAGATPILVDIDPRTFGLKPEALIRAISPRTRAIMPVWLNGRSGDITHIKTLAQQHGLAMVEDAACALGSWHKGQHAGTFGNFGCISFNTTKIITTGTGGIILTNDDNLYEKVERLKNHGRLDRRDYHPQIGFNFGFSDLLAALGIAQMAKLSQRILAKKAFCRWYFSCLRETPGIQLIEPEDDEVCFWHPDIFVSQPTQLKAYLHDHNIQVRLYYPPLHTQPCYQKPGDFAGATTIASQGLWLPAAAYMTEEMAKEVCNHILDWIERQTE